MGGKMAKRFIILGIFLVFTSTLFAQTTGKIKGRVTDASSGEAMPFANVYIEGTTMGAATNMDGEYVIMNVPVGTYTLVASVMGYANSKVNDVIVSVNMTTPINFRLSTSAIKGEEVVVTAKRPVIERDMTSSGKRMSGKEITQTATKNYQQVVASQAGASETKGRSAGLHIRGGRNDEVVYIVDGINTTDPVNGQAGAIIDNNAISEMLTITGGFEAEYGKAMSGVVNIVTSEGSVKPSGTLKYTTDGIFPRSKNLLSNLLRRDTMPTKDTLAINSDAVFNQGNNFGYNDISFTYGGPVFKMKKLNFFTSLGYEGYSPSYLPHTDDMQQRGTLKLSYKINNKMKTTLSSNYAYTEGHGYSHGFSRGAWLDDLPFYNKGNSQINIKLNHSINSKTFYNINIGRFNTYTNSASQTAVEDNSFMGKVFGRHTCRDYRDFKEIGTYLPWVSLAFDSGWYNPKTKEWRTVNGVEWNAEMAWRYYYEKAGMGHTDGEGNWAWNSGLKATDIRDAYARRYYQNTSYAEGKDEAALTEDDSIIYRIDDSTFIYSHKFNLGNYIADVRKYISDTTGAFDADSFEPSGNLSMIRYNAGEWGMFGYYFSPQWNSRNTVRWSGSFQMTSQMNKYNEVKVGGELERYELKYTSFAFINTNPYMDHYNKNPITSAGYVSDKIEYEDMVLKLGIRADYFNPVDSFYIRLDSLQAGKEEVKAKYDFSPRFGISYAVSDKAVMYANYGHFFQPLNFSDIYQNLDADITNGWPTIGNPNLPPQKEIMYETGFKYAMTPDFAVDISGYFKDIKTLLTTRSMTTVQNKKLASYSVYELYDFAVVKGFEVAFIKRASEYLSGSLSYGYQQARGTGSSKGEAFELYQYSGSGAPPNREFPLEFDIPHTIKSNLNFYLPEGFGPKVLRVKILSDLNTNVQFGYSTGAPYTPSDAKAGTGEIGSKRMPSIMTTDMRIDKGFLVGGKRLSVFMTVNNLFNVKNVMYVYTTSGRADIPSFPAAYDSTTWKVEYANYLNRSDGYRELMGYTSARDMYDKYLALWKRYYDSPYNYSAPRFIQVGLEFKF
jgi:hypothetical protein